MKRGGAMTNGNGSLTFKWLVPILITILLAAGGALIADTKSSIKDVKSELALWATTNQEKIECLEREKLDKDQYYRDLREIKNGIEKINDKLDKLKR
jgi:hypothetical protein